MQRYTALHIACLHGHHTIQAKLREFGANEKVSTHSGQTTTQLRQSYMASTFDDDYEGANAVLDDDVKVFTPVQKQKSSNKLNNWKSTFQILVSIFFLHL